MECSRKVRPWPFGQVMDALNRCMVEEWHGAQCIGGGSAVTRLYRLILMYLRPRDAGFRHCGSKFLSQRNITVSKPVQGEKINETYRHGLCADFVAL